VQITIFTLSNDMKTYLLNTVLLILNPGKFPVDELGRKSFWRLLVHTTLPWAVIIALCGFSGELIQNGMLRGLWTFPATSPIITLLSWMLTLLINRLFNRRMERGMHHSIVTYSLVPFYFFSATAYLFPAWFLTELLGLSGIWTYSALLSGTGFYSRKKVIQKTILFGITVIFIFVCGKIAVQTAISLISYVI
jgi:hypothetical protein